ncbi:CDP-diacylglycerol--glycerol-3-phosphate 3-phosphatidyltransferase [candidate division KSB1 bacterium]|nr:CDP-diacylglycerol--glycerol-3-phosphate 3-phosphatidyltransferase [candidate division KSB1 bacterium]RQW02986.1 MAG: CDP-diacylglycerol--glycerol-3-phosphate 3-phosphatidyltransferase [candidate division KSB1 bacterium]
MRRLPNIITISRILITPIFIYAFFQQGLVWRFVTLLIFILSTATDRLDGYLARKYGWESALGKFLDPLADKVLITSAFVCLVFVDYIDIWMVAVMVLRDFVVTWLRSFGTKIGKPVHTMEIARWKTGVQTVVIYLAFAYMILKSLVEKYGIESAFFSKIEEWRLIWVFMLIATLFTLITGIIYIFENKHLFAKKTTRH